MTLRELITKIGFTVDERGLAVYDKAIGRIYEKTEKMYTNLAKMADHITNIGQKATLFLSAPIAGVATVSVIAMAKVEQFQTSFEVMLNSAERAKSLMGELFEFEAKTPFNLEQTMDFANQLLIAKEPASNLTKQMMMLGNVTAGNAERMKAVVYVLGQVRALGYLQGQDMMQFTNALVPIREAIAQVTGLRGRSLQKAIESRQITANIVQRALERVSRDRNGMMERQAHTVTGLLSTLNSAVFRLRVSIGKLIDENIGLRRLFQTLINFVNKVSEGIDKMSPAMRTFIAYLGVIAFVIGPVLVGAGMLLKAFIGLQIAIFAMKATGFSAVIAGWGAAFVGFLAAAWPAILALTAGYLIIQDLYMYMKHGESASLIGPMLSKAGAGIYNFVQNWIRPAFDDFVNYFKGIWNDIRAWWDTLWSDPWKMLRDMMIPDWLETLVASMGYKGASVAKQQYAPSGMFMPALQASTGVSIGTIQVNATMPAGTTEQQLDAFKAAINPVAKNMFMAEAIKSVNRQKK